MKNIIKLSLKLFLLINFIFSPVLSYSQDGNTDIKFSVSAGFYDTSQTISLTSEIPAAEIRLTSDGSDPGINSFKYVSPFKIAKTTVVKARLFSAGLPLSEIITQTYFINEKITLPVVSISTNPKSFFDPDTGIYVMGPDPGTQYPYFNANFWKDWERPVHFEFFETGGERVIDMDLGVKIFGAWSRAMPQKSLALFARKEYGAGKIKYKFFEGRAVDEFESIVLRNSGNDWDYTMFRDALMQRLVSGIDLETQAYRPAVLFINGQYWGIHNIREKINEHFLASYHNVNPDSIDLLENDAAVISGTNTHYKALLNFMSNSDLSIPKNYTYVKLRMDVDNFINYEMAQIYFQNNDWPGNNIKFWRPQRADGKWRWLLYDTDFGFGLFNDHAYNINSLDYATAANGPGYPNPPWSTFILRKLLTNQDFRNSFISRFSEFSNTIFKSDQVVSLIRKYKAAIEPEIRRHLQRWGTRTFDDWIGKVNKLETFAQNRIQYMRTHFVTKFGLNESRLLILNTYDSKCGSINLEAVNITNSPWSGSFFKGIPLRITAAPSTGYVFKEWKGIDTIKENSFVYNFINHLSISPIFVPGTSAKSDIVINEINYNSTSEFDCEDWVELYNNSDTTVDLSGWIFKDGNEDNAFMIPNGIKLPGNGYIVLCNDTAKFAQLFPEVKNKIGDLGFSISNSGELVRILDNNLKYIDSVNFRDSIPWPMEPDGSGATLALKDPLLDNYLPGSWTASAGHGTPGAKNDVVLSVLYDDPDAWKDFYVKQNFPNPFNLVTKINYATAKPDYIRFRVFDVLGREIFFRDEGYMPPGIFWITFSADNLASGVYYYQISRGNESITKKMILLR